MVARRISSSWRRWAKAEPELWLLRYNSLLAHFWGRIAAATASDKEVRWLKRNGQRVNRLRIPSRGFAPHWWAIDKAFSALFWLFETYATVAKWIRRRFSKPQTAGSNPAGGSK